MDAITSTEAKADMRKHAAVWFEIPVTDLERSKAFYAAVLRTSFVDDNSGPNPMANFAVEDFNSGVSGHLYPGKPAADGSGPTIHLAAPEPLEETLQRVGPNGGKVLSPIVKIPPGRFAYCLDPDGNSIGLFTRG